MKLLFKIPLMLLLFIVAASFIPQEETEPKGVYGLWRYQMQVCEIESGESKMADFSVYIQKGRISSGGNVLQCNSCWKRCEVGDKEITFPKDDFASPICTRKLCPKTHERCGDKGNKLMTDFFSDMQYELKGDSVLVLRNRWGAYNELKRFEP